MVLGSIPRARLAVATVLLILGTAAAPAATIRIEAEDFVEAHNVVPDDIHVVDGVLYGLDFNGEWTRYVIPPALPGAYSVLVKSWGVNYTPYHLQIVLESPPFGTQRAELYFTGRGTCGA